MIVNILQANNRALLVFPGIVHREPHGHASWFEYQYVIDAYGGLVQNMHEYIHVEIATSIPLCTCTQIEVLLATLLFVCRYVF